MIKVEKISFIFENKNCIILIVKFIFMGLKDGLVVKVFVVFIWGFEFKCFVFMLKVRCGYVYNYGLL